VDGLRPDKTQRALPFQFLAQKTDRSSAGSVCRGRRLGVRR
jgi:hypothetical protein